MKYFLSPAHEDIAKARYYLKDDKGDCIENDISEVFKRVTDHLFQNDIEYKGEALRLRLEKKYIDAGRPLAQAGTSIKNLCNCLCLGFKADTREAISELKTRHFHLQAMGAGVGINFSTLRPRGSFCKKSKARSSGSIGFVTDISYQSANLCTGGNRSGATLGMLEDWHPDLYDFIKKKSESNWENIRAFATIVDDTKFSQFQWKIHYPWQTFNVSIGLSDSFMKQVLEDSKEPWILQWKNEEWGLWEYQNGVDKIIVTAPDEDLAFYKASTECVYFNAQDLELIKGPYHLTATEWFNMICDHAHRDGCPGVIFLELMKRFHNIEYASPITCTNGCSELPLPDNGVCNLGSLILPTFLDEKGKLKEGELTKSVKLAIRGLDNTIDITKTGDKEVDNLTLQERRVGLGTTGLAELLIKKQLKYSSQEGRDYIDRLFKIIRDAAYDASIELAKERGSFPLFDYEQYSKSEYFKTLPVGIKRKIKKYGIRNAVLLTAPPVGTTGTIIGYSQGIEPYFAMMFKRNSRVGSFLDGSPAFKQWLLFNNFNEDQWGPSGPNVEEQIDLYQQLKEEGSIPDYFEEAHEVSPENHVKMQGVVAKYLDSNVAKTINMPASSTVEDVEEVYKLAYQLGVKSTTVYRDGSKGQILEHIKRDSQPIGRPKELPCDIYHTSVKGELWTILIGLKDGKPFEVFGAPQTDFEISKKYREGKITKQSSKKYTLDLDDFKLKDIVSLVESDEQRIITRLISTLLRNGVGIDQIVDQLQKTDGAVVDFSKALIRILKKYLNQDEEANQTCPQCGSINVKIVSGCPQCLNCSWTKCE